MPSLHFEAANYRRLLAPEVYGSIYASERARNHELFARHRWPARSSIPDLAGTLDIEFKGTAWLLQYWQSFPATDRRPATLDEVLGRMGLDAMFVAAAGGLKAVLPHLPSSKQSKFELPIGKLELPLSYFKLDPAIRSVIMSMGIGSIRGDPSIGTKPGRSIKAMPPTYTLQFNLGVERPLRLIYARNGAGKSYYTARHAGCVDCDEIVSAANGQGAIHALSRSDTAKPAAAIAIFQAAIDNPNVSDLIGQYAMHDYLRHARITRVLHILIIDPPEALITTRLLERGWSDEKIASRAVRWQGVRRTIDSLAKCQALFYPTPVASHRSLHDFPT